MLRAALVVSLLTTARLGAPATRDGPPPTIHASAPRPPLAPERSARARRRAVEYRVAIPDPASQYVEVTMTVERARSRRTAVAMPAWIPGSYKIRDYARHVDGLRAESLDGRPLEIRKRDKQTWELENQRRGFRVRYRVFADERSVRTNLVDTQHAVLNSPALLLYVVGELDRAVSLEVAPPPGWQVHAPLPSARRARAGAPAGTRRFAAESYDELVDSPLLLGTPALRHFSVAGARVELVVSDVARGNLDVARAAADARTIVQTYARLMGGLPLARYVMFLEAGPSDGGGIEHERSALMMVARDGFGREDGYRKLAHLIAHEFFHLWNVKRIHDRALGPFDYTREVHSRLLWFHEGFTETVENQALVRAGLTAAQEYLDALAGSWTAYQRKPGRDHEPISLVSHDAWTRLYQSSARDGNSLVSYYEKGHLIGVALDLELRLRSATRGRRGALVGVFRRLMASHGARDVGIELQDIIDAASAEAGEDMTWFFRRHVEGTTPLQLPRLLEAIGVRVISRAPWQPPPTPPGAPPSAGPTPAELQRLRAWIGLSLEDTRVDNVEPGSPAARAGLMLGDELIAVDRRRVRAADDIRERLADHQPGERVVLSLFRSGQLHEVSVLVALNPHREFRLELVAPEALAPAIRQLRDDWLATCDPASPVDHCVLRAPAS